MYAAAAVAVGFAVTVVTVHTVVAVHAVVLNIELQIQMHYVRFRLALKFEASKTERRQRES